MKGELVAEDILRKEEQAIGEFTVLAPPEVRFVPVLKSEALRTCRQDMEGRFKRVEPITPAQKGRQRITEDWWGWG
ncbi:hypothetical protein GCM10008955_17530 [Deinococcus malanensis]|uniref:Uncharacterized protein n=1 Tax=Deinococcus malanensis TaxID=1706855 RepID=A0ABQ2EWM1_9DEIO|nr:hypothetical protein GCM10008955_17530 [Deinococcus malanensis]